MQTVSAIALPVIPVLRNSKKYVFKAFDYFIIHTDYCRQIFQGMNDSKLKSNPPDPTTAQRIESQILEKVHSGHTIPCGWLFRNLTFYFNSPNPQTNGNNEGPHSSDLALTLTRNTTRFAGANNAHSLRTPGITHVIVNPDTTSSSDIKSLRESLAALPGRKVPHLVGIKWVDESWKNRTLLDEESKLFVCTQSLPLQPLPKLELVRSHLIYT